MNRRVAEKILKNVGKLNYTKKQIAEAEKVVKRRKRRKEAKKVLDKSG